MFTLWEIAQIIITILAVGYIFSGIIRKPKHPLEAIFENKWFDWENVKYAALATAPAVIFHEFAHKFLALGFGYQAIYQASWFGLAIGIFLRLASPGFIFFIPGYVSVSGIGSAFNFGLVALVGPLINLAMFAFAWVALRRNWWPKWHRVLHLTKIINLWLFIFNMLPIPGLDGFKFYYGIWSLFF